MKRTCFAWSIHQRPLLTRVEIINTYILSKAWHATQLCPISTTFGDLLKQKITSEVFPNREKALIDFPLLCYPRNYGGLGLHNPEMMMLAMNGKAVARMMKDEGDLGTAFKLQLLRTITETGGDFFRLLARGKWAGASLRMPISAPPLLATDIRYMFKPAPLCEHRLGQLY
jgi:hypothetical protein